MDSKVKGFILGAVGGAAYGTNPLFAVPLYSSGISASSVVFYRYLSAVVIIGLMAKARGENFGLDRKTLSICFSLGLMVVGSSLSLFHSYNFMDVGIASTIFYVYPVVVAAIMAVFFNERLGLRTAFCIMLAMLGIALLYVGDGCVLSTIGTVLALVSALTYAIYMACINKSRVRYLSPFVFSFYILLSGLSIYLPLFVTGFRPDPITSSFQILNIMGIALIPTILSFVCTASAVIRIGSTPASILGALEPATAVVVGVLVFGEVVTFRIAVGMLMILAAVLVIISSNK